MVSIIMKVFERNCRKTTWKALRSLHLVKNNKAALPAKLKKPQDMKDYFLTLFQFYNSHFTAQSYGNQKFVSQMQETTTVLIPQ
jgi:hypothetical protein